MLLYESFKSLHDGTLSSSGKERVVCICSGILPQALPSAFTTPMAEAGPADVQL